MTHKLNNIKLYFLFLYKILNTKKLTRDPVNVNNT
jgi:hypothetical protein